MEEKKGPLLVCKGICGPVTWLPGGLSEVETQLEAAIDSHAQEAYM